MNNSIFYHKHFKFLFVLISAILLYFSLYYFLERVICLDGPIYLLNMVNYEKFDIPTNRFIAIFTQIIPLLLIKLKFSLKAISIGYSLNFMLFHLILAFIMLLKFKDTLSALMLLFAHVLSGNINFYFPISEYQMGLSLLIFFMSYLFFLLKKKNNLSLKKYVFLFLLMLTVLYAHPLIIYSFIFYVLFSFLKFDFLTKKYLFILLTSILFISLFKWLVGTITYDIDNASKALNFKQFLPYFWKTNSYKFFIHHTISFNYFYFLAFVVLGFYLFKKEIRKAVLFTIFLVSYILMVMIVNFNEPNYNHYTEHLYQAIAYIISVPLFFDVFVKFNSKVVLGFLILFFAIKFNTIHNFSSYNGYRISWIKKAFKKNKPKTKILFSVHNVEEEIKYSIWIVAIESLLISAIDDKINVGTIHILRHEEDLEEKISNPDIFLTDWGGSYSIKETMSKYYFPLDSSNYYYIKDAN